MMTEEQRRSQAIAEMVPVKPGIFQWGQLRLQGSTKEEAYDTWKVKVFDVAHVRHQRSLDKYRPGGGSCGS